MITPLPPWLARRGQPVGEAHPLPHGPALRAYCDYLSRIETAFEATRAVHPAPNPCKAGCGACCRGPFNVSVADATLFIEALDALPRPVQAEVVAMARQWEMVAQRLGGLSSFYGPDDDEALDRICEDWVMTQLSCPVLDPETQACRIHPLRPLTCRMGGMLFADVDTGEEAYDKCPIRGGETTPPPAAPYSERELFALEKALMKELWAEAWAEARPAKALPDSSEPVARGATAGTNSATAGTNSATAVAAREKTPASLKASRAGGKPTKPPPAPSVDDYETTIPSLVLAWAKSRGL